MFGKNELVGQKYFKDAPEKSLMVTSKFFTVQGEGPYMGFPAYFIRLSKCNLNCSFCDAFFDQGEYYTYEELFTSIRNETPEYFRNGEGLVVLTGGEPFLQDITPFVLDLTYDGFIVQIESNGILVRNDAEYEPGDPYLEYPATIVVSPKCSEKTGKYLAPSPAMLENAYCLKFVLSADPESPYHKVPDWAFAWKNTQEELGKGGEIYVSPMNIYERLPAKARGQGDIDERSTKDEIISFWEPGLLDLKQNQLNHEYAARYALDNNLRLNLQMHLYASLA